MFGSNATTVVLDDQLNALSGCEIGRNSQFGGTRMLQCIGDVFLDDTEQIEHHCRRLRTEIVPRSSKGIYEQVQIADALLQHFSSLMRGEAAEMTSDWVSGMSVIPTQAVVSNGRDAEI